MPNLRSNAVGDFGPDMRIFLVFNGQWFRTGGIHGAEKGNEGCSRAADLVVPGNGIV